MTNKLQQFFGNDVKEFGFLEATTTIYDAFRK